MPATYRPGDVVPRSGIYRIDHDSHRLMHEASLVADTRFPRCKQCGSQVRFTLLRAARSGAYVLPFRSTDILEEYPELEPPFAKAGA
jgi:hypothetical protein